MNGLAKSLSWMGLAQIATFVLQFASTVVMARYLSIHDNGIYAVALATIGLLSLLQALGLQALIVREEELTAELRATAFTINALIGLLLAGSILLISVAAGRFLGDPGVATTLQVLSIMPLIGIFSFLPTSMLQREGAFKTLAITGIAGTVASTIATIALVLLGFRYLSAAYAQWCGGGVQLVLLAIIAREHAGVRVSFAGWRRVADFGLQMLAVSGVTELGSRLSDLALGRIQSLADLGLYSRAASVNNLLWNNIHLVVGRVLLTDFSAVHRRGESLRGRYLQTMAMVTALLWPAFAGLAVVAGPFVAAIYGEKWVPVAVPLAMLAIASLIQTSITMTWEVFASTGNLRIQTRIEFIRAGLALATFVGGCFISLNAAAAARVLDAIVANILYRPHLARQTATSWSDYLPIYGGSAALTLIAIAPALAVMGWYRFDPHTPLLQLGPAIVIGLCAWAAALCAMRHPLAVEIRTSLRRGR